MNAGTLVGTVPALPGFLKRTMLGSIVPAERLAAWRFMVAVLLLVELIVLEWPHRNDEFGPAGLARPTPLAWFAWLIPERERPAGCMIVGIVAALGLLSGRWVRLAAMVALVSVVSLHALAPDRTVALDRVVEVHLFLLMFARSGEVWRPRGIWDRVEHRTWVAGWPMAVLLALFVGAFFTSGVHHVMQPAWRDGTALPSLFAHPVWSRGWLSVPTMATYTVLVVECGMPLAFFARLRGVCLLAGAMVLIGLGVGLRFGSGPGFLLACCAPFLPWERLSLKWS